jgi:hypothetical protein
MGTTLNGTTPQNTYPSLIKVGDNSSLSGTAKVLSDGEGNDSILALSTTAVGIGTNTPSATLQVNGTQVITNADITGYNLYSSFNIVRNGATSIALDRFTGAPHFNLRAAGGTIASPTTQVGELGNIGWWSHSGTAFNRNVLLIARAENFVGGLAQTQRLSIGMGDSGSGSDYYYEMVNGNSYFGAGAYGSTPIARVQIKGKGTTSATTSLLVQNSAGTDVLKVQDNSVVNARGSLNVLHPSIATRSLTLGWGSIFATDTGSELTLGAVFSVPSSPQILLAGNTRSSGANTIQLQASLGVSIAASVTNPNASAQLDISSTNKGFLPPRMTTAQRDAIVTPATGLRIYNTTTNTNDTYNGTAWQSNSVSGGDGAIQFSDGSAFASDAANLFWDDTNNRLGVGTNEPLHTLSVQGPSGGSVTICSFQNNSNPTQKLSIIKQFDALNIFQFGTGTTGLQIYENQTVGLFVGNFSTAKAVINSSGNLGIGETSPTARTHIKGSGSTAATTSLLVQNSAGTNLLSITDAGLTTFAGTVRNATGPMESLYFTNAGSPFNFSRPAIYLIEGTAPVVTSGQRDGFLGQFTFAPTSGTAVLNVLNVSPTINQTGGANGITRGLFIDPTLTSAADFRAIEVTAGNVLIGNAAANTAKLSIKGSGTTNATTALLVQNSAGTELIKLVDNGDLTTTDIIARTIYAKGTTLELRGTKAGTGSASLQAITAGIGWQSYFSAESGKDFGLIPRGAVVNGTTIDASAIFQVNSTTKGFLPPRMTTTQKNAISSPSSGLQVYDTTLNQMSYYNGSSWINF